MSYYTRSLAERVTIHHERLRGQKGGDKRKPTAPLLFRFKDIEAATGGLVAETLVRRDGLGCLYTANLEEGKPVIVKRGILGRRFWEGQLLLDNELQVLSRLRSNRFVNLIGLSADSNEKLLVVEFSANGSLFDVIHGGSVPLSWPLRVHLALQTAQGIRALHLASPPIIHRDIKSANVWIDAKWNAKLGGFGFALQVPARGPIPRCPKESVSFLDPDYQTAGHLCTKNDVYCFGALLLEIITGRKVTDVHHNRASVVDWALPLIRKGRILGICDPRIRPSVQNGKAVKDMAEIAALCLRVCSPRPPSMADIADQLKVISTKLPLPPWAQNQN
ncbi:hypothetical protein O6H91_01G100500 [Diphasiastrum complanatum]|uniref:Uncharacterized protein n=2 Tax=Diphasiastrum complanatum TaxID=34168 RepID=A0ACC2ETX3_DIPCM|nr:hypothetical protein O6H91_01G100200 [Diphasiastrum complanatum]KAJ7569921.1 hypothetical protein O6H91_01G100500 [Diphasiastrum complanatum]